MKKTILLFTAMLFCSFSAEAQEDDVKINTLSRRFDIKLSGRKITINEHNFQEKTFLKNVTRHASDAVGYSNLDPVISLEAYTKIPHKKGRYKLQNVSLIETSDVVEAGIFYGGHKMKNFLYPNISPGARGVLKYTKRLVEPQMMGRFFFDDIYPVDSSCIEINYPANCAIDFKLFNIKDEQILFEKTEQLGTITCRWIMKNQPAYMKNAGAPNPAYTSPHIILRISSILVNGEKITINESPADLYQWYHSLLQKIPEENKQEKINQKVNALTENLINEEEKIKAIYNWVQCNIKYVAFENGMAGFIPRPAGEVFTKRYGDCKDMSYLLQNMLKSAGIPAHLTWIGTVHKPYTYSDVPTTVTDNHMICAVQINGDYKFLDATNRFHSIEQSPSMVQGKEALIQKDATEFEIIKVPVAPLDRCLRKDELNIQLEGNSLKAEGQTLLKGYQQENFLHAEFLFDNHREKNFHQKYLNLGKKSSSYEQAESESLEDGLNVNYTATFNNEVVKTSDKIYINLNLDPCLKTLNLGDLQHRSQPIQLPKKYNYALTTSLKIPDGYVVDFFPESQELSLEGMDLRYQYAIQEGQLVLHKTLQIDQLFIEGKDLVKFSTLFEKLVKISQQKIILKKS
ncbi:transglutaminase domain-containing protein [Persicobacter diffluens]|uniref:DUF3857 domain-containing protein n=1 Tax=Persicobacter diffluens TaxID=981 RepID=A0AAN4W1W3_9BACT|nr:hypothetical protein PEDI_33440 [Persicobacter diffluens]